MMNEDCSQIIKAGTLLIIETGEYSDKNWNGPVRVLKDFTKQDAAAAFRKQHVPDPVWDTGPDADGFLPFLVSAGYAEHVDGVHSWHVGSYGSFEP